MSIFEKFEEGKLIVLEGTKEFNEIQWTKHPVFHGVELKHLITAKDTNSQFSYHLVKGTAKGCSKMHTHETQLETHEVIAGSGICMNQGMEIAYEPGVMSIMPAGTDHEVNASEEGVYLFAKFMPALC